MKKTVFKIVTVLSLLTGSALAQNTNVQQTAITVDTTNNRVGINMNPATQSPTTALEVLGTISATAYSTGGFSNPRAGYATFSGSISSTAVAVSASQNLSGSTVNASTVGYYNFTFTPGTCTTSAPAVNCTGFTNGSTFGSGLVSATTTSATVQMSVSGTATRANNMSCTWACN